MKKLKFQLSTAFLFFFSFAVQAQSPADSTSYNREFGFGTNIILSEIFNSGSGPLDFMYRWKSGNGYLRLGTSITYSQNHQANIYSVYHNKVFRPSVYFGKEWRQDVGGRWLINYGMDFNLNYSFMLSESEDWSYGDPEAGNFSYRMNSEESYGAGLKPFVGIMFKISKQLLLGTEASFFAKFMIKSFDKESYVMESGIKTNEKLFNASMMDNSADFGFSTNPASNIFIYYRF